MVFKASFILVRHDGPRIGCFCSLSNGQRAIISLDVSCGPFSVDEFFYSEGLIDGENMKKRMVKLLFHLWPLLTMNACVQLGTLNLQDHQFGLFPTKIIWIQVPGLHEEHLALLRLLRPENTEKLAFEQSHCFGKMWSYNLYRLRPEPFEGLWSQTTGSKNIKNQCEDFDLHPLWKDLIQARFQIGLLESPARKEYSLEKVRDCPSQRTDLFKWVNVWLMRPAPSDQKKFVFGANGPHYYTPGTIYYDRSCQDQNCYSDLPRNAEVLFQQIQKRGGPYLFLVRDFSLVEALKQQHLEHVKEALFQLEKMYRYFLGVQEKDNNVLLLMTSTASRSLEYPTQGDGWKTLVEKKPLGLIYKETALLSPVWSRGARAEHFCGLFDESDVTYRLFGDHFNKRFR
jgi:hypothetical protein